MYKVSRLNREFKKKSSTFVGVLTVLFNVFVFYLAQCPFLLGCFADLVNSPNRDLNGLGPTSASYTAGGSIDTCVARCLSLGFLFTGIQNGSACLNCFFYTIFLSLRIYFLSNKCVSLVIRLIAETLDKNTLFFSFRA